MGERVVLGITPAELRAMQNTEFDDTSSVFPTRLRPHGEGKKAFLYLPECVWR
jgi:hypothetical protein